MTQDYKPDFRALCAELLQELEHASDWDYQQALKDQARAALAQPEPQGPVPVAERLPVPEDCDAEGRCYAWDGYWWLVFSAVLEENDTGAGDGYTHWLPHHALPLPQKNE
jgi:hypothetical protein